MNDNYKNSDSDEEIVELTGDAGDVLKFYHIGTIEYKGGWFVFFQPAEPKDGVDPDEVVIFKIENEKGEDVLKPVEDGELLEQVYEEFMREYDEEEGEQGNGASSDAQATCEKCTRCGGCERSGGKN